MKFAEKCENFKGIYERIFVFSATGESKDAKGFARRAVTQTQKRIKSTSSEKLWLAIRLRIPCRVLATRQIRQSLGEQTWLCPPLVPINAERIIINRKRTAKANAAPLLAAENDMKITSLYKFLH